MKHAPFLQRIANAGHGIRSAFKSEPNFRIQTLLALMAFGGLGLLQASPLWWGLFTLSIAGVLSTELINTALEQLSDLLHPEIHPAIKIVKDCAAGAVLIFSAASLGVFICFLISYFNAT